MKNVTFTSAGIALLILLQLGTLSYMVFGRHRGHQGRDYHQMKMNACPASFKGEVRGHGNNHGSPHKGGPGHHEPMFLEGLNLTPEQQTKIDALKDEHRKSEEAIRIKTKELRTKQFQLLRDEKLDDAQAESIATQLGQYKKEEVLARLKFFRSVQQVLTKEQKDQLKERMNKRHEGRDHEGHQD